MTRLLLVDDAAALADLFAHAISDRLDADVDVCVSVVDVDTFLDAHDYDLAIVDLSFPQESANGLDALAAIYRAAPSTRLAIMTQGDAWVGEVLRDAWELLPIRTVLSKTAPFDYQLEMISGVLADDHVEPDPAIKPLLPAEKNDTRARLGFDGLVQHQGHAKLWRTLMDPAVDSTYRDVATATGLKLNTIKNYRSHLLDELRLHGLDDPSLREMHEFAWRCRAFLGPIVEQALRERS